MLFVGLVCGPKRKASNSDEQSGVKNIKMAGVADCKLADRTREMRNAENMEDWGRAADAELERRKLTVALPNARSRLPRARRQFHRDTPSAADQLVEAKPALKRKERSKAKAEATVKDVKAKEPKPERKAKRGGKKAETTEDDEGKEERVKGDRAKDGRGKMGEDKAEANPCEVDRGKERVARAKTTRKSKVEVGGGEKPLKRKGKLGSKTEDVSLAVPIALLAAASIKEPDNNVSVEQRCQAAARCQASKVMIPPPLPPTVVVHSQATDREQAMNVDNNGNDDNGCLSLHMLSHSMQRGSKDDQLYCLQYANDIMAYLKSLETKYVIPSAYCPPIHPETNRCMRATLVDWLIQVQEHQGLLEDSLHLCVAMLDVYLSHNRVTFSQFQLVGITCLFIATKYEERFPPTIDSLIQLTDDSYIYDEVIAMEIKVLKGLNYQLSLPTPLVFLHWFLWRLDHKDSNRELIEMMCTYILSLALIKSTFSKFSASLKSSVVILLSRKLLALHVASNEVDSRDGRPADAALTSLSVKARLSLPQSNLCFWDGDCVQVTGYQLRDLKALAVLVVKELKWARTLRFQGPQEKFNQPQYRSISSHPALSSAALDELAVILDCLPEV